MSTGIVMVIIVVYFLFGLFMGSVISGYLHGDSSGVVWQAICTFMWPIVLCVGLLILVDFFGCQVGVALKEEDNK